MAETFASLESAYERAVQDGVFPGAVAFARNKNGKPQSHYNKYTSSDMHKTGTLDYAKSFGKSSLAEGSSKPMKLDAVFAIASCTKLITSTAVLQIVERGLINLDDDVSDIIPALGKQQVITGLDSAGQPVLRKRQNAITLRNLLTHSAGTSYPTANPGVDAWRKSQGLDAGGSGGTVEERYGHALAYEPGTSWEYGTAIDWAGQVVEKLTGQSLEDHFRKHIFEPLGIEDITFWIDKHPDVKARLAKMTIRPAPDDKVVDYNGPLFTDGLEECFGGQGAYADLGHYFEILYSILVDDEKLLKKETTAQMFKPQLSSDGSRKVLNTEMGKGGKLFIGEMPDSKDYEWGLGALLIGNDIPGWRKKGRLIWSGMPNIYWVRWRNTRRNGTQLTGIVRRP